MRGKTLALCMALLSIGAVVLNPTLLAIRIVRMLNEEDTEPTYKIVIKSEYILKACKDVIRSWPGISWNSDPLEVKFTLEARGWGLITCGTYSSTRKFSSFFNLSS